MSKARTAILELLEERGPGKIICPGEAARLMAQPSKNWRDCMDPVHQAVDALVDDGKITLSRKGKPIDRRRGVYRIRARQSTEC